MTIVFARCYINKLAKPCLGIKTFSLFLKNFFVAFWLMLVTNYYDNLNEGSHCNPLVSDVKPQNEHFCRRHFGVSNSDCIQPSRKFLKSYRNGEEGSVTVSWTLYNHRTYRLLVIGKKTGLRYFWILDLDATSFYTIYI